MCEAVDGNALFYSMHETKRIEELTKLLMIIGVDVKKESSMNKIRPILAGFDPKKKMTPQDHEVTRRMTVKRRNVSIKKPRKSLTPSYATLPIPGRGLARPPPRAPAPRAP